MVDVTEASDTELMSMSGAALLASRILQAPPDRGLVLEAENLLSEIGALDLHGKVVGQELLEELGEALAEAGASEEALEAGEVAYAQLFYGVGVRPVPLVESVYTSEERLLYDRAYLSVREAYAEAGFEADRAFEQPADDLCVELAFMSCLLAGAAAGDASCAGALARFRREHLDAWAPAAVADLRAAATHPLYLAAAKLTAALLEA